MHLSVGRKEGDTPQFNSFSYPDFLFLLGHHPASAGLESQSIHSLTPVLTRKFNSLVYIHGLSGHSFFLAGSCMSFVQSTFSTYHGDFSHSVRRFRAQ